MDGYYIKTFGGFGVVDGSRCLALRPEVERLIALLCLNHGQLPRSYVAGTLWDDCEEPRALSSLRSLLWRLRRTHPDLVHCDGRAVSLAPGTGSDIADLSDLAERLWSGRATEEASLEPLVFAAEFLPGWYDEWVVLQRERMRQLCLHTLESIVEADVTACRFGAAIQVALAAVSLDQLRESPRRWIMAIHLAEGNPSEAIRQYDEYRDLLDQTLGIEPSPAMTELLDQARHPGASPIPR